MKKLAHNLWFVLIIALSIFLLNPKEVVVVAAENKISEVEIIKLINLERSKNGLGEYKMNNLLVKTSNNKASDMFKYNYWSHVSPSGKTPWIFFDEVGYKYKYAGENLAVGFNTSSAVVDAWMKSPTHKDNILNSKYKDIGISVRKGVLKNNNMILVVAEFGAR